MSYYRKNYGESDDLKISGIMLLIAIAFVVLMMVGTNSCSADIWNDGICPKCEIRYELRGVSNVLKYYVCPECGQEVERY